MLALKRVSGLIVTLSESGRALQRPEVAYLDQLVEGLQCHPDCAQRHCSVLSKYAPLQNPLHTTDLQANLLLRDVEFCHFSFSSDNAFPYALPPEDISQRLPTSRHTLNLHSRKGKAQKQTLFHLSLCICKPILDTLLSLHAMPDLAFTQLQPACSRRRCMSPSNTGSFLSLWHASRLWFHQAAVCTTGLP